MYNAESSPGHHVPSGLPGSPGHPCTGPAVPQSPPLQQVPPGFLGPQCQAGGPMHGQQGGPPLTPPGASYSCAGAQEHMANMPRDNHCPPGPPYQQIPSERQPNVGYENAANFYDNYYSHQAVHNFKTNNNTCGKFLYIKFIPCLEEIADVNYCGCQEEYNEVCGTWVCRLHRLLGM